MSPLQQNSLMSMLSSNPGNFVSPGSAPSLQSKGLGAAGTASLLFNIVSWLGSNFWNDSRMREQNRQNLAQWQRENAYNTPLAQMQRLRLAGLNPAMVFTNGSMMNEAASSPQMESYPVSSPVQIDPLTVAQIDLMDAQAEQARANAGQAVVDSDLKKIEKAVKLMDYNAMKEAYDSGLYQRWYEGNLGSDISKSRLSNLEYFETAWNLAILFGTNPDALDLASGIPGASEQVSFSFTKDAFERAKHLFVGTQNLGITQNEVDDFMARLEKVSHEKDMEWWQALDDWCKDDDNWFARLFRFALVILGQRSGSRSLSIKFPGKTNNTSNNFSTNSTKNYFDNMINNRNR